MRRLLLLAPLPFAALPLIWHLAGADLPDRHVATEAGPITPATRGLEAALLQRQADPARREAAVRSLRAQNPEWDFMARTFSAYALAELALAEPDRRAERLAAIDTLIAQTVADDARGPTWFLLPYGEAEPFRVLPARSVFVDGEIALMMGLRRLVEEREDLRAPMAERLDAVVTRMEQSPVLCAESYPDECWLFCTTIALAAMRVQDVLDHTDHTPLFHRWVAVAQEQLVDPRTGLLVSSFHLDGTPKDGPEGSSIFLAAHMLRIVDPAFAADQHTRANAELSGSVLGLGYAREWPASWTGPLDVDSGEIVPFLGASPSASGFAVLDAVSFGDTARRRSLETALALTGAPIWEGEALRYGRGNEVGDAVLLYAGAVGPAWEKVGAPAHVAR